MIEKWKIIVEDGGIFGVLFTDVKLSTAFRMNLLLPNYNHGIFISMHQDLSTTICQIENKEFKRVMHLVLAKIYFMAFHRDPYWILCLLFNINLCDLFFFRKLRYWSDTGDTIYTVDKTKGSAIGVLETSSSLLFEWFNENFMKASNDRSHLKMSCKEQTRAMIDGYRTFPTHKNWPRMNNWWTR